MRRRGVWAVMAAVVVVLLLLTSCTISIGQSPATPTKTSASQTGIAQTSCWFKSQQGAVEGKNYTCYWLTVPEVRADAHSKLIKLAIAIFKAGRTPAAADPVITLQGGPGGRWIQDLAPLLSPALLSVLYGNHDVILVDQRGTGYSQPSLACPEVDALQYQTDADLSVAQQNKQQADALAACRSRLTGQGVNLSGYTTLADANDIHDLIQALKLTQADLYGVSYGTRLALEVMRSFPQGVRSVVLDSTVPPQLKLITNIPSSTSRVFSTLFQGCAKDPSCNARYPDLESVFYKLYADLNAHPLTFQVVDKSPEDEVNQGKAYTVHFHGDDLENLTFTTFYDVGDIGNLPKMIYELKNRATTTAATLYGKLIFSRAIAWGMYFSVECAEDVSFVSPQDLAQAAQQYPAAIRANQLVGLQGELDVCNQWHVQQADPAEAQPVASSIPTLILEGEYDPVTPPANGDLVAKTLSNSSAFLFHGIGHGVWAADFGSSGLSTPCSIQLTLAFWDTPAARPDGSCVASEPEPAFA